MKKRTSIIAAGVFLLIAGMLAWSLKSAHDNERNNSDGDGGSIESIADGEASENQTEKEAYELKIIEMDEQEKEETLKKLFSFMESCKNIYESTIKEGNTDEDALHGMIEVGAKKGLSVACGNRDYNLSNYEQVDAALRDALSGKEAEAEIYQVNTVGVFRYYHLAFNKKNELFVTSASAVFTEEMKPALSQLEKILAYQWEYTPKGWLIWEKALSRNQEMDMHIFCRILPLDEQCRRITQEYVVPVSYFCNNLFLTDWDMSSLEKLEFNDLFEFLYAEEYGKRLENEAYGDGIPKQEFESVIGQYFDISVDEMERYGRYDSAKGSYPFRAIGIRNRVQQLQPSFPEVVRCTENGDGTVTAYVEAVSIEEGMDCYYAHEVTLGRREDGRYVYVGNRVDRERSYCIPAYRARREFEGAE